MSRTAKAIVIGIALIAAILLFNLLLIPEQEKIDKELNGQVIQNDDGSRDYLLKYKSIADEKEQRTWKLGLLPEFIEDTRTVNMGEGDNQIAEISNVDSKGNVLSSTNLKTIDQEIRLALRWRELESDLIPEKVSEIANHGADNHSLYLVVSNDPMTSASDIARVIKSAECIRSGQHSNGLEVLENNPKIARRIPDVLGYEIGSCDIDYEGRVKKYVLQNAEKTELYVYCVSTLCTLQTLIDGWEIMYSFNIKILDQWRQISNSVNVFLNKSTISREPIEKRL